MAWTDAFAGKPAPTGSAKSCRSWLASEGAGRDNAKSGVAAQIRRNREIVPAS